MYYCLVSAFLKDAISLKIQLKIDSKNSSKAQWAWNCLYLQLL